jgi:hypothetical protein
MGRRSGIAGVALLVAAAAGCRTEPAAPVAVPSPPGATTAAPTPVVPPSTPSAEPSLLDPLDEAPIVATAEEVREALLHEIVVGGGIRTRVTGGPRVVTFEQRPAGILGDLAVQRISWKQDGTAREQRLLRDGQACVNRAEGRALETRGDQVYSAADVSVEGAVRASGRPYSCTRLDRALDVGRLLSEPLRQLNLVHRLGSIGVLPEELHLTDMGIENDGTTRHLRLAAVEAETSGPRVRTTFDLWVDGDRRLVRAEFDRLDRSPGRYAATFTYGGVPAVRAPAAADRGPLRLDLAAPTSQVSTSDPEGDVDAPQPKGWFVPSVDLTTFQASYQAESRTMRFRIGFKDLRELKQHRSRFEQTITVRGDPGGDLLVERSARGTRVSVRVTAQLLHYGSRLEPCRGATATVDTSADVVLLSVPVRCVGSRRHPARFYASTDAVQVLPQRSARRIGFDQLRTARPVRTGTQ